MEHKDHQKCPEAHKHKECDEAAKQAKCCPVTQTLYEKYGGEDTISKVVEAFYVKVLADPLVNEFFAKTDMNKQRKHQTNFICFALGGPKAYSGLSMRKAHEGMGLKDAHFDAIVKHLTTTLREFKVSDDDVQAIACKIEGLRNDVLNR